MFVSVDLPMPGEPPSSTSEPGTIPPPSTRSNSPMPVCSRGTGRVSTADSGTRPPRRPPRRRAPRRDRAPDAPSAHASSTSVFHSPQPGQRPLQRGVWCPQDEQTWTVVGRAM